MVLLSTSAVESEGLLYMFCKDINLLYSLNLDTQKKSFIGILPQENILQHNLISEMVLWNNKLFLLPGNAKSIWIYSLDCCTWEKIDFVHYEAAHARYCFKHAVVYQERLFVFGGFYPAVLIIDLHTYEVTYFKEPFLKKEKMSYSEPYFRGAPVQKGSVLYFACCIDNTVLKFDMSDQSFVWLEVGDSKQSYSGIVWDKGRFLLASAYSLLLIEWDGERKWAEHEMCMLKDKKIFTHCGILKKGKCFLIPSSFWTVLVDEHMGFSVDDTRYIFGKQLENGYLLQDINGTLYYEDKTGIQKIYPCHAEDEIVRFLENRKKELKWADIIFEENQPFRLKTWLSMLFEV